ncbi:Cytochrome protein, partial [Ophiophagus hannah]
MGEKSIEHQIEELAKQLVEHFAHTKGQPFDPSLPLINSVTNVVYSLSFGYQFDLADKNFQKLIEEASFIEKNAAGFFHLSKNDSNSTYNEENLASCLLDLLIAGTNTTISSLNWALLTLVNHPEIQEKVHKEIEDVFGSSGSISYQDRKALPYTNAVIHEIMRAKYSILIALPRQSTTNVKIGNFHIPKGTIILPDLRSVLLDPEEWETPEEFNPNHFLDKDGNFRFREAFLPFGI